MIDIALTGLEAVDSLALSSRRRVESQPPDQQTRDDLFSWDIMASCCRIKYMDSLGKDMPDGGRIPAAGRAAAILARQRS